MSVNQTVAGIVLAAGKGTRMKSDLPKVLHPVCGIPMVERVLTALEQAQIREHCAVLSKDLTAFAGFLASRPDLAVAIQEQQQGTADAVGAAAQAFEGLTVPSYARAKLLRGGPLQSAYVLICYGDMPALSAEVLREFVASCFQSKAELGLIGMRHPRPTGYGRLVLDKEGRLEKIVEEKDATPLERTIDLCNTGIVFARARTLFTLLDEIRPNNAQKEYYLTDCFAIAHRKGLKTNVFITDDYRPFDGVNDPEQLKHLEDWIKSRSTI